MVPQAENSSTYGTTSFSTVPAVERALDILELLESADTRLSLTEIARQLELPKGSAHRLLTTLKARGYIDLRGGSSGMGAGNSSGRGGYGLGGRLAALAARTQGRWDVARAAQEPMRRLSEVTGEGCQLSVRLGGRALCVARVPSPSHPELSLMGGVGSSFPLHAVAVGKALLAFAPEADRTAYLYSGEPLAAFTPRTLSSPEALAAELQAIRREGIARDREEYKRGLCALAAPIFDSEGGSVAVAAIALPLLVGGQNSDFDAAETAQTERRIENAVRAAAAETSRALGWRETNFTNAVQEKPL